jgi:hypothetical protein
VARDKKNYGAINRTNTGCTLSAPVRRRWFIAVHPLLFVICTVRLCKMDVTWSIGKYSTYGGNSSENFHCHCSTSTVPCHSRYSTERVPRLDSTNLVPMEMSTVERARLHRNTNYALKSEPARLETAFRCGARVNNRPRTVSLHGPFVAFSYWVT